MNKIYLLLVFGFITLNGCDSKDEPQKTEIEYLDLEASMGQNQNIEFPLGSFLSEGNTEITKQAEHYEVSEITYEESGLIYNYRPIQYFSGIEHVEITKSSSIGDHNFNQKTVFRINITVE
ncbi:hypothetical protein [Gelidibacter pelagius]|uniref:DUF4377 domain-containing protein n=1 Tax=Gelidibacter pelagius TaxID=2819985 RepID=A0ABS3SM40_9FLAO|nr:hypothetical protein [Gelidibacter pelagius]MBO3096778.1 hypothetical protein [Gelidibacter pelagius]